MGKIRVTLLVFYFLDYWIREENMFIHNKSNSEKTYIGQTIHPGTFFQIEDSKRQAYANDETLLADILSGDATVSINGTDDIEDKNAMINYIKGYGLNIDSNGNQVIKSDNSAFASSVLADGKILYLKIHGMKAIIPANGEHEFQFTIPYLEAYLQGAEIFVDILAQTDMTIKHPVFGVLEQYGFDVCTGKIIYKRQADYASRLPQGLIISAKCKNTETTEQEMGVNFILHEVRNPAAE